VRAVHDELLARATAAPADARGWVQFALFAEANAHWVQAAEAFDVAQRLVPNEPLFALHAAIARGWIDPGSTDAHQALAQAKRFERSAPWKQYAGDVLLERGEIESARALFEQAAALAPERPEPHAGLGECALEDEHFALAVEHLERALKLDPSYRAARYLLGRALQGCGREDEARRELALGAGGRKRRMPDRLTRELGPLTLDFERVLCTAAEWIDDGRAAKGEALLRQHAARHADDPRLGVNLGVARMRQRDPRGALEWFEAALKLDASSHFAHINRSACLLELGRVAEAAEAAEAAVVSAPGAARAHLQLARAYAALGDPSYAARAAQRAVELEPRDPAARHALAQALLSLGEDQRALPHFEAQRDLLPHRWQTHADLARAYALAGEFVRAREAFERARELAPDEPELELLASNMGLETR
jgi:tetratricopeptide (TPR) repeat protein